MSEIVKGLKKGYVRMLFQIPKLVQKEFKKCCIDLECTMTTMVIQQMEDLITKHGGVIETEKERIKELFKEPWGDIPIGAEDADKDAEFLASFDVEED